MNNSESGRKLNQAVNNTSKAVGGALSQAKEAFTSFWSTFTTPPPPPPNPIAENSNECQIDTTTDTIPDTAPDELTEPKEGVTKQVAMKLHNDLSSKQVKNMASNQQQGIVEIGREADTLDSNRQTNDIIDI